MNNRFQIAIFSTLLLVGFLLLQPFSIIAQITPPPILGGNKSTQYNPFQDDTVKSKGKKWSNPTAKIYYRLPDEEIKHELDSSILYLHRLDYNKDSWLQHLGNLGTPLVPHYFQTKDNIGPRLGYRHFDEYGYHLKSLPYFNTTRPYSLFKYSLGSKQEQFVSLLHTQNITRDWNVAVSLKNINSPGFFQNQLATHINGFLSSNYHSKNQRYRAYVGLVYNKYNNDENGGIISDSFLTNSIYSNRSQIPTFIPELNTTRSVLYNNNRNIEFSLDQHYSWGKADTLYNQDSTAITPIFTPRFRLRNQFIIASQRHLFLDKYPEYSRYSLFADSFSINNSDSLRNNQFWNKLEDRFSINGFIGKSDKLLKAEVGIGFRWDQFHNNIDYFREKVSYYNNYIFGKIQKEALDSNQWQYEADVEFYFAGNAVRDFNIEGRVGKNIANIGGFLLKAKQQLAIPSYEVSQFNTNFFERKFTFEKQSLTQLSGEITIEKLNLKAGINNYLLANYIYYDQHLTPVQQSEAFNVLQLYAQHKLSVNNLRFITDLAFQQKTANAPINVPMIMIRNIAAYESKIINNKLHFIAGFDWRYNSPFHSYGYSPIFNQFYFQTTEKLPNQIQVAAFVNFKVKRLGIFVSGDQLQQIIIKKNAMSINRYPFQNAMIRFGFRWELMN